MHAQRSFRTVFAAIFGLGVGLTSFNAHGQIKPLAQREVGLALDSGLVQNQQPLRTTIFMEEVVVSDSPWVRLRFAEVTLGEAPPGGQPTILRITSRLDGAVQTMTAEHAAQWSNTSAYFNGDAMTVQIIADPGAMPSRLAIDMAWVGIMDEEEDERTICGPTDDRVLSSEPGQGRLMSIGCTAWIINDAANCFLTAGHCTTSGTSVVQFNVPLSSSSGTLVNPPPEHQYAVDLASVQTVGAGGVGNDWKYFGCHPNTNTGLTPHQAQLAAYNLASSSPAVSGQQIRITGYGLTTSPVSPTWNQVQKTHSGPYSEQTGNTIRYQVDTTGGNSGSPVVDLSTGLAIGIHTHAGCDFGGGANQGTAIHHPGLQAALGNPLGVCYPQGFTIQASSKSQAVCAPAAATYTISIGQVGGQTDPVTLSANNIPAGATVQFSVNPVIPPGASVMTINNTAAAAPGTTSMQVVGTTTNFTHTIGASISISNAVPPALSLVSPVNGAASAPVLPTLSWSAAAQAQSYLVQVAGDPAFSTIAYAATSNTNSHTLTTALNTLTQYYWRVTPSNSCGSGRASQTFGFTTMDAPAILLVDDDDNSPNVRTYYTEALNTLGLPYDLWDVNNNASPEPTAQQMAPYRIIIWFSGDAFGGTASPKAGPKAATETALTQWLEAGGCLFLSSQDYLYDRIGSGSTTPNAFMSQYLGMAAPIDHDVNYTAVNAGANLFVGMGPYTLTYSSASGGPGMNNFSDMVNPNANAVSAFTVAAGGAAMTRDGGVYRTSFWGFPLEAVPTAAQRAALMAIMVNWCGKLNPTPCPADIADDGQVNVNDMLAVINAWGPCSGCVADINGDNQVNVSDLLAVINAWGACP